MKEKINVFKDVQSARDLGEFSEATYDCICSAFETDFDRQEAMEHIKGDCVMLLTQEDEVLGFSALKFTSPKFVFSDSSLTDTPGCYFAGAAFAKEAQGKGLYRKMNQERMAVALERKEKIVFTRTQNPLVETSITHVFQEKKDWKEIADYSVQRIFMEGAYGRMLTTKKPPRSSDEAIQKEHDKLNVERGDAYVVIFDITY